ncbi:hypothetical protein [Mixta gaviniae]|uniref:Uncharacterized protein n=1 Tax=Mixta gaviniae TaxID=665914 RepID=A0A1X1EER0_9GAMM|nr:hypothetical protein [Mixta gaviniae]AUX94260.1 hypothetical protein C2E15_15035 [Mixta gaviniae]ORM87359.1 hypothetical protein HA44_01545 [Mixta gaviniae]
MNKLTAEVARMDIVHLREHQADPHVGLSLREEKYLQALEIALPVLEQQESDGWIEWKGGECPTDIRDRVDIKLRDYGQFTDRVSGRLNWEQFGVSTDIIAYRVIENDGSEG